jgi:murein DD-endopeptidase MepM/ murein hydrolase activator NlpD
VSTRKFGQGRAIAWASGLIAIALIATARAQAQTTTTTTTTTADPAAEEPADETQAPKDNGGARRALRLRLENVTPQKIFFRGSRAATFEYEIAGSEARDLLIEVVPKGGGEVVQRWQAKDVEPGQRQTQTWGGKTRDKDSARSGAYLFRVREKGGALARRATSDGRRKAEGDRSFGYFDHIFPIRGKHTYGDGVGAPRSGHTHQGQDVFADCGATLRAARGGRVQWNRSHSAAGYYLVIDGKRTKRDFMYAHMLSPSPLQEGDRVRTGQRIGQVGATGNASGCHLHFEVWSGPGWYEGGHPLPSVRGLLKAWDVWS